jgi:cytochrome d ubiquinol oxidase subunit I
MQAPADFEVVNGRLAAVDPLSVFQTPAWFHLALHSSLSCYIATGFAVAGVYAVGMLRGRRDAYHRSALDIALVVGGVAALLQPLSGDLSARRIAEYQPAKLAAMEAHYETGSHVPLLIGGIPDGAGGVKGALRIPSGLSLLVGHSPATVVTGLNDFPEDERPPVGITHVAFQVMVACGVALAALTLWYGWRRRRGPIDDARLLLRALVIAAPLGYVALEAGWIVTEVGRQPWMIYGVMRTSDGVTPVGGVPVTLFGFGLLYLALGAALAYLLRRLADRDDAAAGAEVEVRT